MKIKKGQVYHAKVLNVGYQYVEVYISELKTKAVIDHDAYEEWPKLVHLQILTVIEYKKETEIELEILEFEEAGSTTIKE